MLLNSIAFVCAQKIRLCYDLHGFSFVHTSPHILKKLAQHKLAMLGQQLGQVLTKLTRTRDTTTVFQTKRHGIIFN
jgi:hypothetical protein